MRARIQGDGGVATTQLVLATPALLTMLLVVVQLGVWLHAAHVVHAAAQEGARAARVETGTAAAGQAQAERFLGRLAGELLTDHTVTASRSGATAQVEVTGRVLPIVPLLSLPVRATSEGPIEQWTTP